MHKVAAPESRRQGEDGLTRVIAYVGLLSSGSSLLHCEIYTGKLKGALTYRSNPPFVRRRDLENPTTLMQHLQKAAFQGA